MRIAYCVFATVFLLSVGCDAGKSAGTDSSSQKVPQAAEKKGEATQELAEGESKEEPEALLIGTWDARANQFETLLVTRKGFEALGFGVAFPHKGTWWKVDRRRDVTAGSGDDNVYQKIFAGPKGTQPPPAHDFGDDARQCEGWTGKDLLFVGDDLLSFSRGGYGYCEGAAHPWQSYSLETLRPALWEPETSGLEVSEVLGKKAWEQMETAGLKLKNEDPDGDCNLPPESTSWAIEHEEGRWVLKGWLGYESEACRSAQTSFAVPFELSQKLTGGAPLPATWDDLKKVNPDITDAVAAADGKLLVLVSENELRLQYDGKQVATYENVKKGSIVMTRTLTGEAPIAQARQAATDVLK